ncbi:hypothetical protein [Devosia sp.]|uniref:hypothetical protein n=1 Tax=Devosia sp. TaxID=1871048 RepID=UPI0025F6D1DE|nr:hypothetical protein [Devosia sp.]MCR6634763.1 hypothetical protein [Devosia sp.]
MLELSNIDVQLSRYPGFSCFKTYRSIKYERRWFRQALVVAALDPLVLRMGPCPIDLAQLPRGVEFAFWVQTPNDSRLIALPSGALDAREISRKIGVEVQTRVELTTSKAAKFAGMIWTCKRQAVPVAEHYALLDMVHQHGDSIALNKLAGPISTNDPGRVDAIFSLISNGYLETDVRRGFRPDAVIQLGPLAKERGNYAGGYSDKMGDQLELFPISADVHL